MAKFNIRAAVIALFVASSSAFAPIVHRSPFAVKYSQLNAAKGFGTKEEPPSREKSDAEKKRDAESSRYDDISTKGGQEYNIFVRKFGGDDTSWFPCGSIAVPRGAQVSDAIYSNIDNLKTAIVRTYPKLKGEETDFEFGFNLKIYPDDPVEVAMKNDPKSSGPSVGNWISNLLSPVDTSKSQ